MIPALQVWHRLQVLAARLGMRVDELLEIDAADVQQRLRNRRQEQPS